VIQTNTINKEEGVKYYLALNHGSYEGWELIEIKTPLDGVHQIIHGETYGLEVKILKEVNLLVNDKEEGREMDKLPKEKVEVE